MSQNSILTIQIHWPRFKIALHNPETFLYFPAALVCLYDPGDVLIEIRAYRIKTVVFFFIIDDGLIDITGSNICRFPIFCRMVSLYKSFGIVLLFLSRRSISVFYKFFCAFYLAFPYMALIIAVFYGVRDDQFLFNDFLPVPMVCVSQAFFLNPSGFVKYLIPVFF